MRLAKPFSCRLEPGFLASAYCLENVFQSVFKALSFRKAAWKVGTLGNISAFIVFLNDDVEFHFARDSTYFPSISLCASRNPGSLIWQEHLPLNQG